MYFLEGSHLSYPELNNCCVKYITYFKESILPNWSHTFLYNSIKL